jgi:hypothetical protein
MSSPSTTKRGTCEQWIKEGKGAIKWTRLSCRSFAANAVRLQLHALAYNLGNFLRTLAMPECKLLAVYQFNANAPILEIPFSGLRGVFRNLARGD